MSRRNIPIVLALIAAASVGLAQSSAAASPSGYRAGPRMALSQSVSPATAAGSDEFAGYLATPANGLASASTTFVVPAATGCSNTYVGEDLLFGIISNSLSTFAGIDESCNGDTEVYQYIAQTPAGTIEEPATAGDTVVASMFQTGSWTEAEVHDLTNGQYWVGTDHAAGTDETVGIGVLDFEGPPTITFDPATMSVDQVNGDYLGFESPEQLKLVDNSNHTLIASGSLASHGTSFKLTWKKTY
jgi:hypothetical protein